LQQSVSLGAFLFSGLCILNFSGKTPSGACFASSQVID